MIFRTSFKWSQYFCRSLYGNSTIMIMLLWFFLFSNSLIHYGETSITIHSAWRSLYSCLPSIDIIPLNAIALIYFPIEHVFKFHLLNWIEFFPPNFLRFSFVGQFPIQSLFHRYKINIQTNRNFEQWLVYWDYFNR